MPHPKKPDPTDVEIWTGHFYQRMEAAQIFQVIKKAYSSSSRTNAVVVGTQWYRFSEFMPWFLCQAAAMMPDNEKRHYVIQTAFEELGSQRPDEIHSDMFWSAVVRTGIADENKKLYADVSSITETLSFLREALLNSSSDSQVMGIMLGLEIPAVENIEALFQGLSHSNAAQAILESSKFFKLHRVIEVEHVRHNVGNYLRFCATEKARAEFSKGFDQGLHFWKIFWTAIAQEIEAGKSQKIS